MPVIGRLINGPAMGSEWFLAPFRQGLGDAGFVEGRNLVIEYRWADGHNERLLRLRVCKAELMLSPRSVGIRIVFMVMTASHRNGLNYHSGRGRGATLSKAR